MPLKIGLTGGIASGKSTVANWFSARAIPVIDADLLAKELVEPGLPCYQQIVSDFGAQVLLPDGQLNRAWLRQHVFDDPHSRQQLERILHPAIRQQLLLHAQNVRASYCILVVPLLFEAGMQDLVDRSLVIDVPEALQLQRLLSRETIDPALAKAMLASQYDRQQRLALADDVLDNSGTLQTLETQLGRLHQRYLELAVADV